MAMVLWSFCPVQYWKFTLLSVVGDLHNYLLANACRIHSFFPALIQHHHYSWSEQERTNERKKITDEINWKEEIYDEIREWSEINNFSDFSFSSHRVYLYRLYETRVGMRDAMVNSSEFSVCVRCGLGYTDLVGIKIMISMDFFCIVLSLSIRRYTQFLLAYRRCVYCSCWAFITTDTAATIFILHPLCACVYGMRWWEKNP